MIYYMLKQAGEPVCDFSPVAFIIITPIWAFTYTCVWLGKYSTSHPAYRQDYLLFIFYMYLSIIDWWLISYLRKPVIE